MALVQQEDGSYVVAHVMLAIELCPLRFNTG